VKLSAFKLIYLLIFSVIVAKSVLASPLIVIKEVRARAALKQSWQMTGGYFWYVFGCNLVLFGIYYFIEWLFKLAGISASVLGIPGSIAGLLEQFVGPPWVILSWVIYSQIKEAEGINERGVLS
jgi:hypothetical protein